MKKITEGVKQLNEIRTRYLERHFKKKYRHNSKHKKTERAFTSKILKMLAGSKWDDPRKPKPYVRINVPEIFSIISNPKATIRTLIESAKYTNFPIKLKKIVVNHSKLKQIDLAAESILDLIVMEIESEIKSKHRKFDISGLYPEDSYLKRYIRAIGIIKNLDVKHEQLDHDEEKDLNVFQMRNKRLLKSDSLGQADYKEKMSAEFVDHINSCLKANGRQLTAESRLVLSEYTGEILSNAEEHSGTNEWSIVGYLDNVHADHLCEIAIFNFGKTIASTFNDLNDTSYTKTIIQPYIDLHAKQGWFSSNWNEDDLLTLISLQGDISVKNSSKNGDRGQGTVEMIEFFQKMHKECLQKDKTCARMAIVSGSTHILFDGAYAMKEDGSGRKIIAFNSKNSLYEIPDKKYVSNMGEVGFPGTIIGIRFPLQDVQIQEA